MAALREPGEHRNRSRRGNGHAQKGGDDAALAHSILKLSGARLDDALARARGQRRNGAGIPISAQHDPFRPNPDLHPHKAMAKQLGFAMDDASWNVPSDISPALTWAATSLGALMSEGLMFLGYPLLSEMAQRPEYRTMAEIYATKSTHKWISLRSKSNNEEQSGKIADLNGFLEELELASHFGKCSTYDSYFGRGHLYPDIGSSDNPEELLTPIGNGRDAISKAKVKKGTKIAFRPVEPIWCSPQDYNTSDPLSPHWYKPQQWIAVSKRLHATRLLTFIAREVPDILKPAYSFSGLSLTQLAKPYVDNWIRTRQSVSDLVHSFAVFILNTDLSTLLAPGGGDDFFKRLDLFNLLKDNRGIMALDKNTEQLDQVVTPLGTLDALQAQSQEQMCSVSHIPVVEFTGIQPAGLNADSEGIIRVFHDTIHAYQARLYTPNLKTCIGFAQLSLFGDVDPDIVFDYEPLYTLNKKEAAEVRKIDAETGKVLIDGGVLHEEEERRRVATDAETVYQGLDIEDVPEKPDPAMEGAPGPQDDDPGDDKTPVDTNTDKPDQEAADAAVLPFGDEADVDQEDDDDAPLDDPNDPDRIVADATLAGDKTDAEGHEHAPPGQGGGQFVAQGGGAGGGGGEGEPTGEAFKSKKEHVAHLLKQDTGVTGKEILKATGWKAISMPAMALSLGVKLIKFSKGGETAYKSGDPLTKEEISALKDAKSKKEAPPAAAAVKPEPVAAPKPAEPIKPAPIDASKLTPDQIKKAGKGTYVPPDAFKYATAEKNAFNDKWGGKNLADHQQIAQKIGEYMALVVTNKKNETAGLAEQQKKAKEAAAAAAEKNKAEAAKMKEQHAEVMKELGITDPAELEAFDAFVDHFGGVKAATSKFKAWTKEAQDAAVSYPGMGFDKLSGFEMGCVKAYTGPQSGWINKAVINDVMTPAQYTFEKVLNNALAKLPKKHGITRRGLSLDSAVQAKLEPGKIWTHRNFASSNSEGWGGNTKLHITATGKRGSFVGPISSHVGEGETLFQSNLRLKIDKVEHSGGTMNVHCTEVG